MSEEDISLILDTYMYLDYKEAADGMSLYEIMQNLSSSSDCQEGGIHYGEFKVLSEAVQNPAIGTLIIDNQSHLMNFDAGTVACTFKTPDQSCTYVVYRGTSDGEWPDNGLGMTEKATLQQQRALSYFETSVERLGVSNQQRLIITGHSKGGNKAQYVLMSTKYGELIDVCYNVDGQGFSEEAINVWKEQYGEAEFEKRRKKIIGIYGENDYVNVLGHSIVPKENIYYVQTPVEKTNFAGYHDIKYMFAKQIPNLVTGEVQTHFTPRRNPYALKQGTLGNYAAQLSGDMMALPETKRDGCAAVIMHLMEATRGKCEGINQEKLSLSDVDDFFAAGPELILKGLFFSGAGNGLLHSIFGKESLSCGMQGDVCFAIDEKQLGQQGKELQRLAELIKKETINLSAIQEKLSGAMRGNFELKQNILTQERELHKLALAFDRSAEQIAELVKQYQDSDEAVFNS